MTPGFIFTSFKKELGAVNPYMAIVDSSVKIFLEAAVQSTNPSRFVSKKAKSLGYGDLYLDKLDLEGSKQFVYLSHIAFMNGRAEGACEQIRKQPLVNKPASHVEGDFLRKAIRAIHFSIRGQGEVVNNDEAVSEFVEISDVAVIDYYRKMRNIKFHGAVSESEDKFSEVHLSSVKSKYGWSPSPVGELRSQDMILLSKVWQSVIHDLCAKSVNPKRDLLPILIKKYKGMTTDRMVKGATRLLRQEYLLDTEVVEGLVFHLQAG